MTFLSPIIGGHLTLEGVTFSPAQKGHQQKCQGVNPHLQASIFDDGPDDGYGIHI